ncbi:MULTISPECIES: polysaccharide pyruvyl transferase family protein [unclassified Marinitoga]|uniref:polysaccharide pyruvyl transferase family protein n=1 Tax=unclassified Marinitoga TaxID=2640159 RepID=UPI000641252A|nr:MULTISPECIES: polysaccharide pyruvyl transferase family protein [unclassified Marinitoga]KLO24567.1 hypothetical protein X274_03440 [Marinitoga sp. 1155]NUU99402.1 hypothetical protein [Marinitoga sp. 1154]
MNKIFLIGYYGYNNLGDELLFQSILEIFSELNFDGKVYTLLDKTKITKNYSFKIHKVDKYNIQKIIKIIKECDIVIYGGGNIFQTETSLRSFLYYDFLFKIAKHYKKHILFLSQGFGHFKHKYAIKRMRKLLKYKNLSGILRDETSYRYAKKFSNHFELGTDIGMIKYKNFQFQKDIKKYHISIIIKNKRNWDKIIYLLKYVNINSITPIVLNKSQDAIIAYDFFEKYKNNINISFPVSEENKIINKMLKSEFVISDRLHGGILSLYLGIPVIMYKNQKNYRVFKTIDKKYNLFFKNEDDLIDSLSQLKTYDFEKIQKNFMDKLNISHQKTLEIIKAFL